MNIPIDQIITTLTPVFISLWYGIRRHMLAKKDRHQFYLDLFIKTKDLAHLKKFMQLVGRDITTDLTLELIETIEEITKDMPRHDNINDIENKE